MSHKVINVITIYLWHELKQDTYKSKMSISHNKLTFSDNIYIYIQHV